MTCRLPAVATSHVGRTVGLLAFALLAQVTPAKADIFGDTERSVDTVLGRALDMLPSGIHNVRFGLGPAVEQHFLGDSSSYIALAPVISLRYRDILTVDNNSLRVNFLSHNGLLGDDSHWSAGPAIHIDFGRQQSDSPKLYGLGNIPTAIEVGGYVGYENGPVRYRVRVRHDIADATNGTIIDGEATWRIVDRPKYNMHLGAQVVYGDYNYQEAFFGITPSQAFNSGLPGYNAHAGLQNGNLSATGEYIFTDRWSTLLTIDYLRLMGSASASPLVRLRGSPNQLTGAAFVVYAF